MEWIILPLRRYLDFSGRSRRREFWTFLLFQTAIAIVAAGTDRLLGHGHALAVTTPLSFSFRTTTAGPVSAVARLLLLLPALTVTVRRLHDADRSGWWLLLVLIPVFGRFTLAIFNLLDGARGANRFGPDPKQRGTELRDVFR